LVKKRIAFSAATIIINTSKAQKAIISAFSSRTSEDFKAALSVITPPAVTASRIKGICKAIFRFNIARLARGSSEGADDE